MVLKTAEISWRIGASVTRPSEGFESKSGNGGLCVFNGINCFYSNLTSLGVALDLDNGAGVGAGVEDVVELEVEVEVEVEAELAIDANMDIGLVPDRDMESNKELVEPALPEPELAIELATECGGNAAGVDVADGMLGKN